MSRRFRVERDYLGKVLVPSRAYYGAQTSRAIRNFRISGLHFPHEFVRAYATIKRAAAAANMKSGRLDKRRGRAILKACDEVAAGKFSRDFVLDVYQAGAGTSTNMNLNEVIANRAIEVLGGRKGNYRVVHPNDHVNMSQSTNDTFHSAMHIAALGMIEDRLLPAISEMRVELDRKARRFRKIVKSGRTHTRFAVPISLGDEFSGYADSVRLGEERVRRAASELRSLNVGGTAVGTGANAAPGFAANVLKEINRETGMRFRRSRNVFRMTQNTDAELGVLDSMKDLAADLVKISNDIMFFSSSDVGELRIPSVQPGSSIMPGKVNPSVAEMFDMVAYQVMGSDFTVTMAVQASRQELNVMMPVVAYNLLYSIDIMSNAIETFTRRLLRGLRPDLRRISRNLGRNPAVATALAPHIGYDMVAEVVREAERRGEDVRETVLRRKLMPRKKLDSVLKKATRARR